MDRHVQAAKHHILLQWQWRECPLCNVVDARVWLGRPDMKVVTLIQKVLVEFRAASRRACDSLYFFYSFEEFEYFIFF